MTYTCVGGRGLCAFNNHIRFHNLLITDEFGCLPAVKDAIVPLPTLEDESSPDRDEKMAEALSSYLHSILQIPEVQKSLLLSGFLDEKSFEGWRFDNWGNGCNEGGHVERKSTTLLPITAVDFLLQPFEPQKLYIHRRMDYNRDMIILKVCERGQGKQTRLVMLFHF